MYSNVPSFFFYNCGLVFLFFSLYCTRKFNTQLKLTDVCKTRGKPILLMNYDTAINVMQGQVRLLPNMEWNISNCLGQSTNTSVSYTGNQEEKNMLLKLKKLLYN